MINMTAFSLSVSVEEEWGNVLSDQSYTEKSLFVLNSSCFLSRLNF